MEMGPTVGVAADIVEYLSRVGKRRLGIDDSLGSLQRSQIAAKLAGVAKFFERAEELEFARVESLLEILQEQAAEPRREPANGQQETGPAADPTRALGGESTAGNDAMQRGMMDGRYQKVKERFHAEIDNGQVIIHRAFSHAAVGGFPSHFVDWIYIDGNHLYDFVTSPI